MTTQLSLALPVNARLWLYGALHQVMTTIADTQPNEKGDGHAIDIQLILEMSLDKIAVHRVLPNETLGYNITNLLHSWQEQARDGFTLYDLLSERVPRQEREVFKSVSHETIHACFITALMLVRDAQDDLVAGPISKTEQPSELSDLNECPSDEDVGSQHRTITPSFIKVIWPLSVIIAGGLGLGIGLLL